MESICIGLVMIIFKQYSLYAMVLKQNYIPEDSYCEHFFRIDNKNKLSWYICHLFYLIVIGVVVFVSFDETFLFCMLFQSILSYCKFYNVVQWMKLRIICCWSFELYVFSRSIILVCIKLQTHSYSNKGWIWPSFICDSQVY